RTFKYNSTVNIPKPSHQVKGPKWPTFKPPATTQRRRYRGRVLLRRLQFQSLSVWTTALIMGLQVLLIKESEPGRPTWDPL
ncbi:hypothetical protein, partial [Yoonia sp. R2-816]|uniref:hypothetical protein n=1 Tax=Yoonia sp. R2-816 TaxID=3342638 RepID=UPI00372A5984